MSGFRFSRRRGTAPRRQLDVPGGYHRPARRNLQGESELELLVNPAQNRAAIGFQPGRHKFARWTGRCCRAPPAGLGTIGSGTAFACAKPSVAERAGTRQTTAKIRRRRCGIFIRSSRKRSTAPASKTIRRLRTKPTPERPAKSSAREVCCCQLRTFFPYDGVAGKQIHILQF
jgi:hypothetical protein